MTEEMSRALLPEGLRDGLPPDAAHESSVVNDLMQCFAAHGYERVDPPFVEFEASLLAGAGAVIARQTFRLMDPLSQRMMGLRADMTPQVARIATTRLKDAPRPLRLCYAGEVFRVTGTQLRPERQFRQVGVELIGTAAPARADAEVVLLAAEALTGIGVPGLSVDLNLPRLAASLCTALGLDGETTARIERALSRKDAAAIEAVGGEAARLFCALLATAGPAERALSLLRRLGLPAGAAGDVQHLFEVGDLIRGERPDLEITVDPLETRGFDYHVGVSFTLFSAEGRSELGTGGRYLASDGGEGEPSTGFTLFMDAVTPVLAEGEAPKRVFLPLGTPSGEGKGLRETGWTTVAGLERVDDERAEARRLGCAYVYVGGEIVPLP